MQLPDDGDFLYEEISKLEMHNNALRVQNDRVIKERDELKAGVNNQYDLVNYLRLHLMHVLANEPSIVKAGDHRSFDPRFDCRRCAEDYASLVKFRQCGGKL